MSMIVQPQHNPNWQRTNSHNIHVENFQGRHFPRKENPAGMPTHRTGADNKQKQLKSMEIN